MAYLMALSKCRCGKGAKHMLYARTGLEIGPRCNACAPRDLADQGAIERAEDASIRALTSTDDISSVFHA